MPAKLAIGEPTHHHSMGAGEHARGGELPEHGLLFGQGGPGIGRAIGHNTKSNEDSAREERQHHGDAIRHPAGHK